MGLTDGEFKNFGGIDTNKAFESIGKGVSPKEQFAMLMGIVEQANERIGHGKAMITTITQLRDNADYDNPDRTKMDETIAQLRQDLQMNEMFLSLSRPLIVAQVDVLFEAKATFDALRSLDNVNAESS